MTQLTDDCCRQELYYIAPSASNNALGQLHQLKKPTPTSPAARLPVCAFTDPILYLSFKTIKSEMTTNSLGNYVYNLRSCCDQVCALSCCIAVVRHLPNKRLHHLRSYAISVIAIVALALASH